MSDLVVFLLARIEEDHDVAFGGAPSPWQLGQAGEDTCPEVLDRHGHLTAICYYGGTLGHVLRFDPTRVLAECEAKRRVIAEYEVEVKRGPASDRDDFVARHGGILDAYRATLRLLALPYADHPEYDEAWRP